MRRTSKFFSHSFVSSRELRPAMFTHEKNATLKTHGSRVTGIASRVKSYAPAPVSDPANRLSCRILFMPQPVKRNFRVDAPLAPKTDFSVFTERKCTMAELWVGIDAGKRTHHCVLIDGAGVVVLSTKVSNEEGDLLDLIASVLRVADGREV